jgi:hypothetical protein
LLLVQAVAQVPQWLPSEVRSTHAPPHSVVPALQPVSHWPALQTWSAAQVLPQAPQLS